jgi:hypothetical protein
MNFQILKISEVMEDTKQNITGNQYKIIMDSSIETNNGNVEINIDSCIYTQHEVYEAIFLYKNYP